MPVRPLGRTDEFSDKPLVYRGSGIFRKTGSETTLGLKLLEGTTQKIEQGKSLNFGAK